MVTADMYYPFWVFSSAFPYLAFHPDLPDTHRSMGQRVFLNFLLYHSKLLKQAQNI